MLNFVSTSESKKKIVAHIAYIKLDCAKHWRDFVVAFAAAFKDECQPATARVALIKFNCHLPALHHKCKWAMKNNVHSDTSKKKSKFLSALSFPLLLHLAQFNSLDASIPSTDPDDLDHSRACD
jgi:hypothetical protein